MDRKPGQLTKNVDNVTANLVWAKVIGVGNTAVGKTCLIKHFCETQFSSGYQPTVGVDYGFKIQQAAGSDLRVHLWDLSGNPDYLDVRNELYGNTDAVFLVFDVTTPSSFENLEPWLKEISKFSNPMPEVCLVGNKIDLKGKRCINAADAKKWANKHKLSYFETSCSTGEGVEQMFTELLMNVIQKRKHTIKQIYNES